MNFRNMFKLSTIVLLFTFVLGSAALAQTTVYVNNTPGVGNDFNSGLTIASPKATISAAMNEFPSGTTISVEGTGLLYNETVNVTGKEFIFTSTGASAPSVTAIVVNVTGLAAPYSNQVTFNGPFTTETGLTLTAGKVVGASNLTAKTAVVITEGTVDGQLNFSGTVDFTYNGANNRTTGGELPTADNTTNFGALTVTFSAAKTLTFNSSKTIKGIVSNDGNSALALGGNTLTLTGAVTHVNVGGITASTGGGILVTNTATINGAGALPNVTIDADTKTLTIGASTSIGGLTAKTSSSIALNTAAATTIDNAKGNGSIVNMSTGAITYSGAGGLLVKGSVELQNTGDISFTSGIVTVNGSVVNSATLSNTGTAGTQLANILFNNAAHIIVGSVKLTGTVTVSDGTTAASAATGNKTIEFAAVANLTRVDGGIVNEAAVVASGTGAHANNGSIRFTGRTTGAIGTGAKRVAVTNTSSVTNTYDALNGIIDFGSASTGDFVGSTVSTTGASGGVILFGRGNLDLSGNLSNARTDADGDITFGPAVAVANTAAITVTVAGTVSSTGSADILFNILSGGAGLGTSHTFGGTSVSGGKITLNQLGAAAADAVSLGALTMTGGTLDLDNVNNTVAISVGSLNLAGGTLALGTGARNVSTNAISHTIGGTANTTITPNDNTNGAVFLFTTPTYAQVVQITIGGAVPVIPGDFEINNGTALPVSVEIKGGNLRVLGDVDFTDGVVKLDGTKLIVGQHLFTPVGAGAFTNAAGYTSVNNGAVSMNGNAVTTISGTPAGTDQFGGLEIDAGAQVNLSNAITVQGNLYLTKGVLNNAVNNVTLDNTEVYPTIIRNAGSLAAIPVFASDINITYIGIDKASSFEMEAGDAATDKLNDLTVATTNGAVAGKGIVTIANASITGTTVTVNGTLTINTNQALVIDAVDLIVKGDTMNVAGNLFSTNTGDELQLGSATGTVVIANNYLPDVQVLTTSVGNVIQGAKALISGFLGADNAYGGVADFDPTTTTANGTLVLANGTAGLKVVFASGVAFDGTNLATVTTSNSGNTLQIAANLKESGNITHAAGTVTVDSSYTWTVLGTANSFTSGALTNGKGKLVLSGGATTVSAITDDVTIACPVEIKSANTADVYQLGTNDFIFTGDFTITKGTLQLNTNLTLTGKNFTVTADGAINTVGGGILVLNATTANEPLIWSFAGTPTVGNVTISNDVTMSGGGTAITISGAFLHNGGNLDFGDRNIEVTGTFTRTNDAGTYAAVDGYLILNYNGNVAQASGFSIPNLLFGDVTAPAAISPTLTGAGVITVTKNLGVAIDPTADVITLTVSGAVKLALANGATLQYIDGKFDAAPTATSINLELLNPAAQTVHATVWPATATLIQTVIVDNAAAATLPDSRTVNKGITYTAGTLNVPTTKTLTVANNAAIKVDAGVLTLTGTGAVSYGTGTNVTYIPSAVAYVSNGNEIPATVNNLKFTRESNTVNFPTTLNSAVTVNGTLTIKNNLITAAAAPITLNGNLIIGKDDYALATNPTTVFNAALTFGGSLPSAITVPEDGATIGAIKIAKGANNATVNLVGGNLTTGTVYFEKGLFVTNDNILYIPAPALNVGGGQGFDRDGVAEGNVSHVVGNVAKTFTMGGSIVTSSEGRSEFPVGSRTLYKPVSITFNPVFGIPTIPDGYTIIANHVDEAPEGAVALPIADGVAEGIDVARYPNFYWFIKTKPTNLSSSVQFDIELTSPGFYDFDDINNVRIIRRHGTVADITNQWLLQGTNDSYDNEVSSGIPTVVQRGANAGLRAGGAVFTLGVSSNMTVANPIADQNLKLEEGAQEYDLSSVFAGNVGELTFKAQSANAAVATVAVSGSMLTITPVKTGDAVVTVVAMDEENNDFFSYSFNVNVSPLVGVDEETVPTDFALYQNFPNPFNPSTNIKFDLPKESNVAVRIYNILGEEVATLVNRVMQAGRHTVEFNASRLSSGMYIYRIEAGDFVQVKKMLLMK